MLAKDVDALADDDRAAQEPRPAAPTIRDNARKHRLAPVGIHVMRADGELLAKLSVNDVLGSPRATEEYGSTLAAGLAAHRAAASQPASRPQSQPMR